VVSSLPKDGLAAMAESLVNLTEFKQKSTSERETVAGPIDVAVILEQHSRNQREKTRKP